MLSNIISIILTAVVLRYSYELENKNCECSLQWQHKFIKYFAPVIIFVSLLTLFISNNNLLKTLKSNKTLGVIYWIYLIAGLAYAINLVVYFLRLNFSSCQCSEDWKRWVLLYPVIGFAIVMILVLMITLLQILGLLPYFIKMIQFN